MRLLVDASLPASLTEHSTGLLELEAPTVELGGLSDAEVIQYAADDGFDAVAFLGRDTLASHVIVSAAARTGIALVVTNTHEPVEAAKHIGENFRALERELAVGRVLLVFAADVRVESAERVASKVGIE